jgi:hypothetical protein
VPIYEKRLLDFVEHVEFQVLRNFGREQVKAICMHCDDVHFRHAVHFTELLPAARDNLSFQFSGGLLGKRERNDVGWQLCAGQVTQCEKRGLESRMAMRDLVMISASKGPHRLGKTFSALRRTPVVME